MSWHAQVHRALARRGYQVRQHPAARRQQLLAAFDVDLVLDVGAAIGAYGTELRAFGYRGAIMSFEPLRSAYATLSATAALDGRWTTVHSAIGEEPGQTEINVAGNSDSSSLLPMLESHRDVAPHANYVGVEQVEVRRLDDAAQAQLSIASHPFLKIDTQGFERQVLAGATKTLPQLAGIQIELSFIPLYEGSMLAYEAIDRLRDEGFGLEAMDLGLRDPTTGQMLQADGLFFRRG
jgi:FkbM family methyltransferase